MKRAFVLAAIVVLTANAYSQQHANQKRGFNVNGVYQFNGMDTINAFNGNLTMSIPLGSSYSVGGGLSYGLTLHSNANMWEGQDHCHQETQNGPCVKICPRFNKDCNDWEKIDPVFMYPHRRANAGLGWTLSLGRLYPPEHSTTPDQGLWVYESPDGADHVFEAVAGQTFENTVDGSYLRMRELADDPFTTDVSNDLVRLIEFTDGTIQVFQPPSASTTDYWNLRRITKQGFPGTYLKVEYEEILNAQSAKIGLRWKLSDSHGRRHWIDFLRYAYDGEQRLLVDSVHLSTYSNAAPGEGDTHATIQFNYTSTTLGRGEAQTCTIHEPGTWQVAQVQLLSSVVLPDNLSFAFTYVGGTSLGYYGVPRTMTYPTGGQVEWEWGYYVKPFASAFDSEEYFRSSLGVRKRHLRGRVTSDGTRPLIGTWEYEPKPESVTLPGEAWPDCYSNPYYPGQQRRCHEYRTTITDPTLNKTVHYFSVATTDDEPPWRSAEYGLPYTKFVPDVANSSNPRWLSTQSVSSAGTVLRSAFVRYVEDFREVSRRVTYGDDSGMYVDRDLDDWVGFGNYRKTTTSGTLPGTPTRVTYTDYFASDFVPPGSQLPVWIAGLYNYVTVTESGKVVRTDFCFDRRNGFLTQKRMRKVATSPGSNDILAVFEADARGNVQWESYYGGDILPMADRLANGARSPALVTTSTDPTTHCTYFTGSPVYEIGHIRVEPTAASHGSVTSTYTGVDVHVSDLTIDRRTGLISKSRDTAGVETSYEFDWAGRLLWERSTGRAATKYEYFSTNSDEIKVSKVDSGTSEPLPSVRYRIDALGRVDRETTSMPAGVEAVRDTVYDALGRRESISEPGHPTAQTTFDYDPLGRVTMVTLPDGSSTSTEYVGDRQKTRTSTLRTSTGDIDVPVVEQYDGLGRLISVTEKSGPTTAAAPVGAEVTTAYKYDLADRLIAVEMKRNGGGTVQRRLFDYDGRGFLRWESHPEAGMTSYLYDARGKVVTKLQAAAESLFDLDYFYDGAERLTRVESRDPEGGYRTMKQYHYGTANGEESPDLRKGKLVSAMRKNYDHYYDGTFTITDMYEYGDAAGRKTKKTTRIDHGYNGLVDWYKFIMSSVSYNSLDLPSTIRYPMCLTGGGAGACGYPPLSPMRENIVRTYDRGLPKAASGAAGSITYWPNGMRRDLFHANGVTDHQEVGSMPRPTQLSFGTYSSCDRPAILVQPALSVVNGQKILTVSAAGTNNRYLWHVGYTTLEQEGPSITVNPTETTDYWVEVTNYCGTETSQAVRVTIGSCSTPSTGAIQAIKQSDGAWILTPAPTSTNALTYEWRQVPSGTIIGTQKTYRVVSLLKTTTFSLTVIDGACGSSTATVTIIVPLPMSSGLVATSNSTHTQISLSWPAVTNAAGYYVQRTSDGVWFGDGVYTTQNSFDDTDVQANRTYAYRVYIKNGTTYDAPRSYSNVDVATTKTFALVTAGPATASAADGMLTAVNVVRASVGWPALTWSTVLSPSDELVGIGSSVTARQILACRARMGEALQALGASAAEYEHPSLEGVVIRASHFNEVIQRAY